MINQPPIIDVIIPIKQGDIKVNLDLIPLNWAVKKAKGDSRAVAMNNAVLKSEAEFIWFLHNDSIISKANIDQIKEAVKNNPNDLNYFNLKFNSLSRKYRINEWGVKFRCYFWGTAFGDQGFFIKRSLFIKCGMYNEKVSYGEDHLFTWQVRLSSLKLNRLSSYIITSPIKYESKGWLSTIICYQYMWAKQGLPMFFKLTKYRFLKLWK